MTNMTPVDRLRTLRLLGAVAGLSVALGACTYTGVEVVTASVPSDYRLRHPIAIQEADRSWVIFFGLARGGLSASQRADVAGLAQTWLREGTGAIIADVPVDTPNARGAADWFREIRAQLAGGRRPPPSTRNYAAPLPPGRPSNARDDPAKLSEDCGGCRTLRPVARGSRPLDP